MFLKLPKKKTNAFKQKSSHATLPSNASQAFEEDVDDPSDCYEDLHIGDIDPNDFAESPEGPKKQKNYTTKQLFKALRILIYEKNDKSIRGIAKEYGIPESTLRYRLNKILDDVEKGECPFGQTNRKNLTSAEEEIICNMIYDLSKRGHYTTKTLVINIMLEVMIAD